ncbi:MAG: NAD(P)-dependent oxidoreductase [Pelagibacteraceae bacterium]|jgi:glutamate synthase (NADPH/NADH) small chain|nr:NAD(P)-dependent oxidoreductase [Pelagibacteraceae bacterium]MDP6784726.1 NAD(P)-dependent oxidoreductase [Alphaproteobacteria bacterium]MBO6467481.1 NAD(P)-dependent oxidoreductase [Pelagibacteraceae bacterium]MBO6469995.1 NAD(P)-dependent oxidoreductase [Pelagibacteraceae bacterium]MBO6470755.1 NAD(P)-dependent oxidoreductase [Pelagibacteraceae bacterium]|tara:strand:+ start:383 stop:1834 length:1452 start_codon:yes stop_codon:yes gene_type:complete
MLKFVNISQSFPDKFSSRIRKNSFDEIYHKLVKDKAKAQASRCSQCGIPLCHIHCPLNNNIPDWLKLAAEERLEEAFELSSSTNNLPEICGRICPQDKLCEGNCVIEKSGYGTVTIGSIEQYITDVAWEKGWIKNINIKQEKNKSVGIIGSGPAGLVAAEQLRIKGYQVTIYDRYDRSGGLLIYGIPNFKLEKEVVMNRTKRLEESGAVFKLNSEIGSTISFDDIGNKHDAILIATGVYKPKEINLNKNDLLNVVSALDFLIASNKKYLNNKVSEFDSGKLNSLNKNVLVVGGGDTAMDCVRTAVRQGAKSVKCLYRRDQDNIPGSQKEVQNALEEGVDFKWLTLPIEYIGNGKILKTKTANMQLGSIDESGRRHPEPVSGSEQMIDTDLIIEALGFEPENLPKMFDLEELTVTKSGTLKVDNKTMMTNISGVFAAGDIVRGASLVVWAIKDGRDVADQIHQYLEKDLKITEDNSKNRELDHA